MDATLLTVLLVAGVLWFWLSSLRARERALATAARVCERMGVQFLDQTVALSGLGLRRDAGGRVRVSRRYRFEFSTDGADRLTGSALLLGARVQRIELARPEGGSVIESPGGGL